MLRDKELYKFTFTPLCFTFKRVLRISFLTLTLAHTINTQVIPHYFLLQIDHGIVKSFIGCPVPQNAETLLGISPIYCFIIVCGSEARCQVW